MEQYKQDLMYLRMALEAAKGSYCRRKQVGALLVRGHSIIEFGFNGTIPGFKNECEDEQGETKPEVLHAELNCLMKCAKTGKSTQGATLYLTLSPCLSCTLLIIAAGIRRVVWCRNHSCQKGPELLRSKKLNIQTAYLPEVLHER